MDDVWVELEIQKLGRGVTDQSVMDQSGEEGNPASKGPDQMTDIYVTVLIPCPFYCPVRHTEMRAYEE